MNGSLCRIERRSRFRCRWYIQTKHFPAERRRTNMVRERRTTILQRCLPSEVAVRNSPSRYSQLINQYNITSFNTTEYKGRFDITLVVPLRYVWLCHSDVQLQPFDMFVRVRKAMERVEMIVMCHTGRASLSCSFRTQIGVFLKANCCHARLRRE